MKTTSLIIAAVAMLASGAAVAQDTTTTRTTTTQTAPGPGIAVGVPGVVGVQVGAPATGCTTSHTTKTNEDTGSSVSRTATNC